MKLKKLKIGYESYDIDWWTATNATSNEASGEFFAKEKKIGVDARESGAQLVNTLLHEALHGVVYHQGLKLGDEQEELIVNSMANGLTSILVDNPGFVAWIKEQL
tara:strand:- start:460 stop:774 length:315 start_codon:yes stop_codon:yes gene_type:complete